jgi:hypothetical protein
MTTTKRSTLAVRLPVLGLTIGALFLPYTLDAGLARSGRAAGVRHVPDSAARSSAEDLGWG